MTQKDLEKVKTFRGDSNHQILNNTQSLVLKKQYGLPN